MQAWELIERWCISNEAVVSEMKAVGSAGAVSDEARLSARRLLWVPPAVFGLGDESVGLRTIMRGCLAARMAKDWAAELSWTQVATEREAHSSALSSLAQVAGRIHDVQAWNFGKQGWSSARAGEPAGSALRIICDALNRGLGDERARRAMRSAMERLDPEDEDADALCRMRWSQWERNSLGGVESGRDNKGSESKRI